MRLRLLTIPLLASTLMFSTLGCSKKDDPTTTPINGTGSFKRDGVVITGTARAILGSVHQNGQTIEELYITITEAAPSQGDPRSVMLDFQKPSGGTTGAYQLYTIIYRQGQSNYDVASSYPSTSSIAMVKDAGSSSFSGTFSGTGSINITSTQSILSDGVFTAAPL
jgi:hypothetical protein